MEASSVQTSPRVDEALKIVVGHPDADPRLLPGCLRVLRDHLAHLPSPGDAITWSADARLRQSLRMLASTGSPQHDGPSLAAQIEHCLATFEPVHLPPPGTLRRALASVRVVCEAQRTPALVPLVVLPMAALVFALDRAERQLPVARHCARALFFTAAVGAAFAACCAHLVSLDEPVRSPARGSWINGPTLDRVGGWAALTASGVSVVAVMLGAVVDVAAGTGDATEGLLFVLGGAFTAMVLSQGVRLLVRLFLLVVAFGVRALESVMARFDATRDLRWTAAEEERVSSGVPYRDGPRTPRELEIVTRLPRERSLRLTLMHDLAARARRCRHDVTARRIVEHGAGLLALAMCPLTRDERRAIAQHAASEHGGIRRFEALLGEDLFASDVG